MNPNTVSTEKFGNLTIEIAIDDMPEDPRGWDNLGTMVCFHNSYSLGDKKHGFKGPEDLNKKLKEKGVLSLPMYMMDHSGLTIKSGPSSFQACDPQGWDWGKIGYIFIEPEKIRKEYSVKRITKKLCERVLGYLNQEIETYNQYVQGDVYVYTIKDESGNVLECCGGFFGDKYCLEQAKETAKSLSDDLVGHGLGI